MPNQQPESATTGCSDPLSVALGAAQLAIGLAAPVVNARTDEERRQELLDAAIQQRGKQQAEWAQYAARMALVSLASDVRDLTTHLTRPRFRVRANTEGGPQEIPTPTFAQATSLVDELTDKGAAVVHIDEFQVDGLWEHVALYQDGTWHL
ncbi:hypothetical protein [Nonomuraea jabiensis]|uniref:hypothetical protein n=1 Tax=Nonomuraea jabiensis TaxID=882448 RepID=UPI003D71CA11